MRCFVRCVVGVSVGVGSILLAVQPTSAQDLENFAKGFTPEKAYAVGDLDNVSLFNGNLTVAIPIGQEYPVGGGFSYRFTLHYNSNAWTYETNTVPSSDPNRYWEYTERIGHPAIDSNAGIGWSMHFGMVLPPQSNLPLALRWQNTVNQWLYVDSDGSQHYFYQQLHEGENDGSTSTLYTRDGSYLRLTEVDADNVLIEYPDGTKHHFWRGPFVNHPWWPTKIEDRFGNSLDFSINFNGADWVWTLTDSTGRSHTLVFAGDNNFATFLRLKQINLAAFDGTTATYDLTHTDRSVYICNESLAGGSVWHTLPLLDDLTLPDGSTYEMTTTFGGTLTNLICGGGLTDLTLPTLGTISWEYGDWYLPAEGFTSADGCNEIGCTPDLNRWFTKVEGLSVVKRTVTDPNGPTGVWRYDNEMWPQPVGYTTDPDDHPHETRTFVTYPDGSCSKHYFRANTRYTSAQAQWDHGLPFTRNLPTGGLFDSVVHYPTSVDQSTDDPYNARYQCSGSPARTQRILYDHDVLPVWGTYNPMPGTLFGHEHNTNRRLQEERTIYHDDGNRYAGTVFSSFDGLGHYRTATTNGNFNSGNVRTTTTNYDSATGNYPSGGYVSPATSDPWVLETYDERTVSEGGTTYKEQFCFENATGYLQRRRTLASTGRQAKDAVVQYLRDSDGNTTFERYFGGDNQATLNTSNPDLCAISLPSQEVYEIQHDYTDAYGSVRWSRYNHASGPGIGFKFLDQDIDQNTGLPTVSRDSAEVATHFDYDSLSRPIEAKPAAGVHGARTEYVYINASGSTPAQVDIIQWSGSQQSCGPQAVVKMTESRLFFDGMGRVMREDRRLPGGIDWNRRDTDYTVRGFTDRVSTTWTGAPASWTDYQSYDQFGRAGTIVPPDGAAHAVSLAYTGVRLVDRTVNIQTGSGEVPQTTTEEYDRQGRLFKVTEANGTVTTYGYDPAGRLTSVSMTDGVTTQNRQFQYDGRGFLTSETHPEKSATVTYSGYDARGNATQKSDAGTNLTFVYDRAERITSLSGGGITLKEFEYGEETGTTDKRRGKLWKARRFNRLPGISGTPTVEIEEIYTYRQTGGRVSKRDTYRDGALLFTLGYNWDDIGQDTWLCYPSTCDCTTPEVEYQYDQGLLDSVVGYATLDYHPNLMLSRIDHANNVDDVWHADPSRMRRPARIRTTGSTSAQFDTGTYLYDGAGNITDIGTSLFDYDSVSRLTYSEVSTSNGLATETNTYDAFGNRIAASAMGLPRTNPTDPATNRLMGAPYRPISYDNAGNLTGWGTATYTYDALNVQNRLKDDNTNQSYVYTADDERIGILQANGSDTQMSGRWMLRDLDNQILQTYTEGAFKTALTQEKEYIRREGQLLARVQGGQTRHAHLDHLGTPRAWSLPDRSIVKRRDYLPFGEEVTLLDPEQLQFTGHERDEHLSGGCGSGTTTVNNQTLSTGQQIIGCDAVTSQDTSVTSASEVRFTAGERIELGENFVVADGAHFVAEIDGNLKADRQDLDYMHARYCSPYLGRFTSTDPKERRNALRLPQKWNRFTYARNNPLRFVDPNGEEEFEVRVINEVRGANIPVIPGLAAFNNGPKVVASARFETSGAPGNALLGQADAFQPESTKFMVGGQTVHETIGSPTAQAGATRLQGGATLFAMDVAGTNPMTPGAPAINTSVVVVVDAQGNVSGAVTVDGFPSTNVQVINEAGEVVGEMDFQESGTPYLRLFPGVGDETLPIKLPTPLDEEEKTR